MSSVSCSWVVYVPYAEAGIVTPELAAGAILNTEFPGFQDDYLVLHCLMREAYPASVLEIGTHLGRGTKILANAVPDARVHTFDLHPSQASRSSQHPYHQSRAVGELCDLPFTQHYGDSLEFDFASLGTIDAWYIDGEHDTQHVACESRAAIASGAKLIVWHDTDIADVMTGILQAFDGVAGYRLVRVEGTRISYAQRI